MRLSLTTLKKYLDTKASTEEIVDKLTMIGLEVEEVEDLSARLQGFIIGEIKSVEQHPNADRLHLLKVFDGKQDLQIVCGAPNVRVGLKSILALPGCLIPKFNEKLEVGKIRGVDSNGMLCAEDELLLGEDHTGIIELDTDYNFGYAYYALGMALEHQGKKSEAVKNYKAFVKHNNDKELINSVQDKIKQLQ